MEKLKETKEPTVETNEDKGLEYAMAHRDARMRTLLGRAIEALEDDGPDAALAVLLNGVGEPEKPSAAPGEPELPLRLQLMSLRIDAEREFDQKYLAKCVPPIVEIVKKQAQTGSASVSFSLAGLSGNFLKGTYPANGDWSLAVCRIAAWFSRQGIRAEFGPVTLSGIEGDRLTIYIPKRT